MTPRIHLMAAALITLVAWPAGGQLASIPVGARLRVTTTTSNTPIVGKLVARITDTVHIEGIVALGVSPADRVAALSQVRAIDRSTRPRRHAVLGMFAGAAVGLIAGKIAARSFRSAPCQTSATSSCEGFDPADALYSNVGTLVLDMVTAIGAGVGAIIGHGIVNDTWQPVSLDRGGPAEPPLGAVK